MENVQLRLGLVCINTVLRNYKPPVFCSRTCIRKTYSVEAAKKLAFLNVCDIKKLILWNEQHGIKCLRLSSDMFPHYTDAETEPYNKEFASAELASAGALARSLGHRIVMHPSQFNVVGANNPDVFKKTVSDLTHHAEILDLMGMDNSSVLIVHGGGVYNNRSATIERWIKQFHTLPDNVKRRLVIENCEKSYNTEHVLEIAKGCKIPVIFDFHHYACWNIYNKTDPQPQPQPQPQQSIEELFPHIIQSWIDRGHQIDSDPIYSNDNYVGLRLLMHLSEQDHTKQTGAHSDYIETIPDILFQMMALYQISVDLEIEAKMKEQAILRLYNKYHGQRPYDLDLKFPYDLDLKFPSSSIPNNKNIVYKIPQVFKLKLKT